MQNLIEKMERAIAIDQQDAASSEVAEIKAVARARWPMMEQFVNELKEKNTAVGEAMGTQAKRIAELEREATGLLDDDPTLYEHLVTIAYIEDYKFPEGATLEDAIAESISIVGMGGWRLVSSLYTSGSLVLFYERPLRTTDKNEAAAMITNGRATYN